MEKRTKKRGILIAIAILLVLVIAYVWLATVILTPPRYGWGCMWKAYRQEPKNSLDVLFFGTSIAYTDMIPAVIYARTGLTSFSLAGPVQSITESYYSLREATGTQHPQLVVVELTGILLTNVPSYDIENICNMPQGVNRWRCALETGPAENLLTYFFPLNLYHSRWSEVTWDEVKYNLSKPKTDVYAGWTYLEDVTPFEEHKTRYETYTEESFAAGAKSLEKIAEYCDENGMELLVCISPQCEIRPETMEKLQALIDSLGVNFVNFNDVRDEIGIDDMTDFYDESHLNWRGAQKYSLYLASYFTNVCKLTPAGNEDTALWDKRVTRYLKKTGQTE